LISFVSFDFKNKLTFKQPTGSSHFPVVFFNLKIGFVMLPYCPITSSFSVVNEVGVILLK